MFQTTFGKVKSKLREVHSHCVSKYVTKANLEKTTNTEWMSAKPFKTLPGPSKYHLLRGYIPGGQFYKKSFPDINSQLRLQYGDIFVVPGLFGKRDVVFSFNPKDFQQVFRTEGLYPVRRGFDIVQYYRTEHKKDVFKHAVGLVASQGEDWSKFRSAVNPIMINPKNIKIYIPKMDEVATKFVTCIRRLRDPDSLEVPENFEEYIKYWTMDSMGLIALDTDFNMIENGKANPKAKAMLENLEAFFQLVLELDFQPSLWKVIPTPKFKRSIHVLNALDELLLEYINQAADKLHKSNYNKPEEDKSILERLIKTDALIATTMVMDTLFAGVDTTTSALAACLLSLAQNPDSQTKLREELLSLLPHKNAQLTQENMKNIPYLRACIKESLRLYPITPANFRATGQDVVLSGYRIPANTDISMIFQPLLTDQKYFAQPEKFLPERWLRSKASTAVENICAATEANPFVYLPFGFGPRVCIGKRIVDLELETVLARLLRNFEIKFDYPTDNMFRTHVFNVPAKPLKFKFIDINY